MTWYLIPVAAAVSLVWNATRYESTRTILVRSGKMYLQVMLFMALILGVLMFFSYSL